ncbi:hypothetical protein JFT91_13515 [Pseudomonas sp. TH08]|uniref:hypothetical protein n=1 Tax=unclassified Pseudomonas TaxID=196821 RepID=UPI001911A557|nr:MULTISPECIES: hypothetical protein [unclassified Pseudomonas]MBK5529196.1 hypothetical protein [Pseudomonas sp. TH06]MBK5533601.1 hypothetical protein [Pseudomonas sp. TH08]
MKKLSRGGATAGDLAGEASEQAAESLSLGRTTHQIKQLVSWLANITKIEEKGAGG